MKATENDPDELSNLSMFKAVFGANSAYSVNHKGKSSFFRSECNLEKVRHFHEKFYHASNCCLIVVGDIEKEDLFRALAPVLHNTLRSQRVKPIWTKPWLEEKIELSTEPFTHQLEYPYSYMERPIVFGQCHVKVGIIGPSSTENLKNCLAMRFLLEYLMSGPIPTALACASSTNQPPTEKLETSFATTVNFSEFEYKQTLFTINFLNVSADFVRQIPQVLRKALLHVKRTAFKLRKMVKIILNHYQNELAEMETSPEAKISRAVVTDFLYAPGNNDLAFDHRLNSVYTFHHFLSQNGEYWKDILQKCFLDATWITVVASPSQSLFEKLQGEMMERIEWRLGTENVKYMKRWAQRLKTASRMLNRSPPLEYLNKYPLPSSDSIGLITVLRQDNPLWASDTVCNLFVDDINSNYAYLTIVMDTSELTIDQKKYMVLFAEGILQSPYIDNWDNFHTSKECEREINKDVISCETYFGLEWLGHRNDRTRFSCGNFPHLLCLQIQIEVAKIKEGFYWAQMLLWNTKWQADRLREVATKLIKDVDELQNDGSIITRAILTDFFYHMNSTPKCVSLIRQKLFLQQLIEEMPKSIRRISKILESIRNCILRPDNMTIHLAASLPRMEFHLTENPDARFAISELFRTTFNFADWTWDFETKKLSNCPDSCWMKSPDYIRKCCSEQIFPMQKSTLGYLLQAAPGVTSYSDSDYPLLLTIIQYFIQQPDGPLYKELIQTGLAEYLDICINPLEGLIYFELRGCPDLTSAYTKTFDVMSRYLFDNRDGEGDVANGASFHWDSFQLQCAKSSMIFKLTQLENTPMKMGQRSLLAYYKGLSLKSSRNTMDAITKLTMKQAQTIARRYFYPLFLQPSTCAAAVPNEKLFSVIDGLMQ